MLGLKIKPLSIYNISNSVTPPPPPTHKLWNNDTLQWSAEIKTWITV